MLFSWLSWSISSKIKASLPETPQKIALLFYIKFNALENIQSKTDDHPG